MKRKYKASQKFANELMRIYREMDNVTISEFNQDQCSYCVIGHSIRLGVFDRKVNPSLGPLNAFQRAIQSLHVPRYESNITTKCIDSNIVSGYLFGSDVHIKESAKKLGLSCKAHKRPKHAQMRIKNYLEASDFDIVWNC